VHYLTINDRDRIDWHEGMTVQEVLDAMGYSYALITVTVNDRLVPEEDYSAFQIPDKARVTVFHLAHGG
jgi:thiamine biosynthesis protein ThiS